VTARFFLRNLRRESRGSRGRLVFFVACLAVGVAAVVAVAGLAASLERTIRGEARFLLAADLVVQGRRPIPPEMVTAIQALPASESTGVRELVTVVAAASGRSQLVELKVLDGHYPFYGRAVVTPDRPLAELLDAQTAVVGPDLLARLDLEPGDLLRLGGVEFRIAGVVSSEPDRMGGAFTMGPRVFLSGAGLQRTVLEGRGSRVLYRVLVKLPPDSTPAQVKATATRLEEIADRLGRFSVETYTEAQPTLRQGIARAERFLGLVALLSLLIGGVGVAQTVRAWLAARLDAIAVLKALGARPREVLLLYLGQTAILALAGSAVGIVLGTFVQWSVPALLAGLLPAGLERSLEPWALLRGLALGLGVSLLFGLPPMLAALRVPPVRVLRRDAEPLPLGKPASTAVGLALVAGVFGLAAAQSGSAVLGLQFALATLLATAVLAAAARLLSRFVVFLLARARFASVTLRHGLAGLARPGAGTTGAIVGLGLGVLVVLSMAQVESQLAAQFDRELPKDAPTAFLTDIQNDQWAKIQEVLRNAGATRIDSVPVVMARLTAIGDQPVLEIAGDRKAEDKNDDGGSRRWALTREQRLTYLEKLAPDNKIVEGRLWSDPKLAEVSLEQEFAADLGAKLGTVLHFDIQGVPLELTVTSIRTVRWESFGINFFLVAEPGVLERAPQFRLASVRLPPAGEQRAQDLLAVEHPNVTMLPIGAFLERVSGILRRIGLGVRFLGAFTVLAGLAILAGAVAATSARRGREVALRKTLGMTRRGVASVFAVEYALIGLVASVVGAAAGGLLAWTVLTRGMEVDWHFEPWSYLVALLGTVVLTIAAGLAASWGALQRRPIEVLRAD
jgi:putative ABC transport system permease protein